MHGGSFLFFFKLRFTPCKGETSTMRDGVTRRKRTNILKHTGKLIRKNLDLFCWNYLTCNIKVIINAHKP